jgi:hypothetical protein
MNVLDSMELPDITPRNPQQPLLTNRSISNMSNSSQNVKFMLICSRDIEQEELDLLQFYSKVLVYDDCHINIPLDQLVNESISYVIFDVRKKSHRMAISKEMSENFHVVAIIHKWQEMDDFIDDANCENCLASFPPKQAFKRDFDKLLLERKIRKPSCMKNIFRVFFKAIGGWQKE